MYVRTYISLYIRPLVQLYETCPDGTVKSTQVIKMLAPSLYQPPVCTFICMSVHLYL